MNCNVRMNHLNLFFINTSERKISIFTNFFIPSEMIQRRENEWEFVLHDFTYIFSVIRKKLMQLLSNKWVLICRIGFVIVVFCCCCPDQSWICLPLQPAFDGFGRFGQRQQQLLRAPSYVSLPNGPLRRHSPFGQKLTLINDGSEHTNRECLPIRYF